MSDPQHTTVASNVASIINRAWPCYVHYADPRDLVGDADAIKSVLAQLHGIILTGESHLPNTVPPPGQIIEAMALGHEHNPACVALAKAITRCVPALAQAVKEGRCGFTSEDQRAVRDALANVHRLHHRLDPTGEDDTPLIEALCTQQDRPLEVSTDWRYMVRLTQDDAMGGPLGAFDYMPMRCFTEFDHARNWAVIQAVWECHILGQDVAAMLNDPRQTAIVNEITGHDGTDREWRLPFTHVTLRFTSRPGRAAVTA